MAYWPICALLGWPEQPQLSFQMWGTGFLGTLKELGRWGPNCVELSSEIEQIESWEDKGGTHGL